MMSSCRLLTICATLLVAGCGAAVEEEATAVIGHPVLDLRVNHPQGLDVLRSEDGRTATAWIAFGDDKDGGLVRIVLGSDEAPEIYAPGRWWDDVAYVPDEGGYCDGEEWIYGVDRRGGLMAVRRIEPAWYDEAWSNEDARPDAELTLSCRHPGCARVALTDGGISRGGPVSSFRTPITTDGCGESVEDPLRTVLPTLTATVRHSQALAQDRQDRVWEWDCAAGDWRPLREHAPWVEAWSVVVDRRIAVAESSETADGFLLFDLDGDDSWHFPCHWVPKGPYGLYVRAVADLDGDGVPEMLVQTVTYSAAAPVGADREKPSQDTPSVDWHGTWILRLRDGREERLLVHRWPEQPRGVRVAALHPVDDGFEVLLAGPNRIVRRQYSADASGWIRDETLPIRPQSLEVLVSTFPFNPNLQLGDFPVACKSTVSFLGVGVSPVGEQAGERPQRED